MRVSSSKRDRVASGGLHFLGGTVRAIVLWHHVLLPLLLLWLLYREAYRYWDEVTWGEYRWDTTWPRGRTRLVLLMFVIPVWGALMAALTVVYVRLARTYQWKRAWHAVRQQLSRYYFAIEDYGRPGELTELTAIEADGESDSTDDASGELVRRRSPTSGKKRFRSWQYTVAGFSALPLLGLFLLATYEQKDDIRYRSLLQKALDQPLPEGYHTGERYFIAANFYNNEEILPRWVQEITKVIRYLGPHNVFVSIYESNSEDNTSDLLRQFDAQLFRMNVDRLVITKGNSIPPPRNRQTSTDRIAFLAAVRNKVMEPLYSRGGFDRVLFLNDIFFEAESVVQLLHTRDGDWDQVCAMDFSYWGFYDAWVTRDRLGSLVSSVYPYIFEDIGMRAIMAGEPAPVFSCWNGLTALRAIPFLSPEQRNATSPTVLSHDKLWPWLPIGHPQYSANADRPPADMPALRFRTSVDGYECFSSECFLISYDFNRQFGLTKVYMNPTVIVGYEWEMYVWYKFILRHWLVKWWIETVERGREYMFTRVTIGQKENVYSWDGGHCFPFE